ncbi:MAG: hypothetical protein ACOZIN_19650 [Myxococcota bacterium]
MFVVLVLLVLGGIMLSYASSAMRAAGDDRREKESLLCAEEGLRRGAQWVGTTRNTEDWPAVFATETEVQTDVLANINPPTNCTRCILGGVSDSAPNLRVFVYLLDNPDGDNDPKADQDLHAIVRSYCVDQSLRQGGRLRMVEALIDRPQMGDENSGSDSTGNAGPL